jgi:tryptophanyl-tRNA synthetase
MGKEIIMEMKKEKKENEGEAKTKKYRILSGMRPTGALHVGHLKSVIEEWIKFQEEKHKCFFLVADLHALTTDWEDSKSIRKNSLEMVKDWLAAGISPEKSVIFLQSDVPEHTELFTILGMITPMGLLERNPTYKEALEEFGDKERLLNLGFFSYPVLQTADILLYKAEKVPVGKDQIPHIEIARDIAEKFNRIFGNVFPLPEPVLSESPKILGSDGRKMSKSYNNAIFLTENINRIKEKVMTYMTDTARKTRKDPGEPERCPLYTLHRVFSPKNDRDYVESGCRTAQIGCIDCKKVLLKNMIPEIEELQKKREEIGKRDDFVIDVLKEGGKKAKEFAQSTMEEVRRAVFPLYD